jgi:hypothetical protein
LKQASELCILLAQLVGELGVHFSFHGIVVVSLVLGQAATSEPVQPKESGSAQANKTVRGKPPRRKAIVQPADSIPPLDQTPDCIFMPSPLNVVDAMLKLANVRSGDVVFDLGSGDARICIAAAKKYGARAYGYEIQADLVKQSLENVKRNKVEDLVTIERRDIFKLDLSGADVVTLWLLPLLNARLIPQLDKMKPGSRIVSFDFDMMDIVKPERVIEVEFKYFAEGPTYKSVIYLWKTPLKKDDKLLRRWQATIRELLEEEQKKEAEEKRTKTPPPTSAR